MSFGYNNLVSDMRSLAIMRARQAPVVFDPSVRSSARRHGAPAAASATWFRCWHAPPAGRGGPVFMEPTPTRPRPLSDGPNAVPCKHMKALLETLVELDLVTKKNGFLDGTTRLGPDHRGFF